MAYPLSEDRAVFLYSAWLIKSTRHSEDIITRLRRIHSEKAMRLILAYAQIMGALCRPVTRNEAMRIADLRVCVQLTWPTLDTLGWPDGSLPDEVMPTRHANRIKKGQNVNDQISR